MIIYVWPRWWHFGWQTCCDDTRVQQMVPSKEDKAGDMTKHTNIYLYTKMGKNKKNIYQPIGSWACARQIVRCVINVRCLCFSPGVDNTLHFFEPTAWTLGRHYQQPICSALILVKDGDYPELRIKAYSGRVLPAFLQEKVAQLITSQHSAGSAGNEVVLMVHGTLSMLCKWFLLIENAPRYLSADEAEEIWATSLQFLRAILRLSYFLFL